MSKRIVVLEGADSSGKTTLAREIASACPGKTHYFHGLPYIGWVEEAHAAMLSAAIKRSAEGDFVVIDRHWISEFVYGPRFRNRIAYSNVVATRFDQTIRRFGTYVLCVPGDAKEHERQFQRERPDKKDLFDTMVEVAETFRRLSTGYMHHEGNDLLSLYIRHGDFGLVSNEVTIYDIDTDGRDVSGFVMKLKEKMDAR